jgi:hypothetical protein
MVVEHVMAAADILDRLPPNAPEAIRDYSAKYAEGRQGTESDSKRAWVVAVIDHLDNARLRERRLYTGITGRTPDEDLYTGISGRSTSCDDDLPDEDTEKH